MIWITPSMQALPSLCVRGGGGGGGTIPFLLSHWMSLTCKCMHVCAPSVVCMNICRSALSLCQWITTISDWNISITIFENRLYVTATVMCITHKLKVHNNHSHGPDNWWWLSNYKAAASDTIVTFLCTLSSPDNLYSVHELDLLHSSWSDLHLNNT